MLLSNLTTPPRMALSQDSTRPPDKAVLVVSLLTFLVATAAWVWFATAFPETGNDFTEFYLAGNVPVGSLYDQEVFREHGARLLTAVGVDYFPPYVRPAIFSLPLRAVMWLPYWPAFAVFGAAQFACYLLALILLARRFHVPPELLAGFGLFYPGMMGIVTGQDANALALGLALALLLLIDRKERAAGLVLALCLYKFNLVLLLPVLLFVHKRFEALKWFVIGGAILAISSAILTAPADYIQLLANISSYTIGFSPDKMIGLRSLAYGLGHPWMFYPLAAITAAGCFWAMVRLPLPQAFSIAILGTLLCSYHVNWYDGAVVLVPLLVAFGSRATFPKAVAAPLLFAFPIWAAFPKVVALLVILLLGGFAAPALARGSALHPAPDTHPEPQTN